MAQSDSTKLHDLQSQLDQLSTGAPDAADAAAAVRERAGAALGEVSDRVHAQVDDAKAAVSGAAGAVSERFSAAADASRAFAGRAQDGYRQIRDRTGLSDGALLGTLAGGLAALGLAIAVPARRKATVSTLTLPGGREITLSPAATRAATRFGKLSSRARHKAEKRIHEAAEASASLAEKSRKRLEKAQRTARKQLNEFSPADQLAAMREAAAPLLNGQAIRNNAKAGTDWLKDASHRLQEMGDRFDTRPVKAQAGKAAKSTRVAAQDVAAIPVTLRDALVEAGWRPPVRRAAWRRVFGI